jgi:hypothetical protein
MFSSLWNVVQRRRGGLAFGLLALTLALILSACAVAASTPTPPPTNTPAPLPTDTPEPPPPTPTPIPEAPATLLPEEDPPAFADREFATDFSKHVVPYDDILSGGPPKDGIPAIDEPTHVGVDEADEWLEPQEPVILVEVEGDARAYPIQILTWHEIVNDTITASSVYDKDPYSEEPDQAKGSPRPVRECRRGGRPPRRP